MSDDGRAIVVGTIATQGDPNLLQLDGDGKIVGQHLAGQRWVNEAAVSNDGRFVAGLCATPEGTSGDVPRVFGFLNGQEVDQIGGNFSLKNFRPDLSLWHYGDHSNHLARILCRAGKQIVMTEGEQIEWLSPGDSAPVVRFNIGPGFPTALAASSKGVAVVGRYPLGFYYTPGEAAQHAEGLKALVGHAANGQVVDSHARPAFQNLIVVGPDRLKPLLWSRPASTDVAPSPAPKRVSTAPPFRPMRI